MPKIDAVITTDKIGKDNILIAKTKSLTSFVFFVFVVFIVSISLSFIVCYLF